AQPRESGEAFAAAVGGQVREPVIARRLRGFGPFDDQPFLARRQAVAADRVAGDDADKREAARDLLAGRCRAARKRLPGTPGQPRSERPHRFWLAVGPGDRSPPPDLAVALGYRQARPGPVTRDLG